MIQNKSNNYSETADMQQEQNFDTYKQETEGQIYQDFEPIDHQQVLQVQDQFDQHHRYNYQGNDHDLQVAHLKGVQVNYQNNNLMNENQNYYSNQQINSVQGSEVFNLQDYPQNSHLLNSSPKSDSSQLMDKYNGKSNNQLFDDKNHITVRNDKSTSASSSLTNTPPLSALRGPNTTDKQDELQSDVGVSHVLANQQANSASSSLHSSSSNCRKQLSIRVVTSTGSGESTCITTTGIHQQATQDLKNANNSDNKKVNQPRLSPTGKVGQTANTNSTLTTAAHPHENIHSSLMSDQQQHEDSKEGNNGQLFEESLGQDVLMEDDNQDNYFGQSSLSLTQQQSQTGGAMKRGRKQTAQNVQSKSSRENEIRAKQGNNFRQGRWTKEEHFRFLEALKIHGKEWRKVQMHVGTRTSTQARSHAQKFFVKIEKKEINLDEFLRDLDMNNLEKSMLFSDLEDEDEPPQRIVKQPSVAYSRKDSNRSLNESENSVPKSLKAHRKKSVMSYALDGSEMEEQDQILGSPSKSTRSHIPNGSTEFQNYSQTTNKVHSPQSQSNYTNQQIRIVQKSDTKRKESHQIIGSQSLLANEACSSPTRTMQMRQSKANHAILQKRYREDDSSQANINTQAIEGNLESEGNGQVETQIAIDNSSQNGNIIERKCNKRRVVENPKQSPFLEPAKIIPSLAKMQSAQPQTAPKQQAIIPLTPNLKHSDPQNIRLYDDKHVFKRSNSQNEFDFLTQHNHGLFDFHDPSNMLNHHSHLDQDFFGLGSGGLSGLHASHHHSHIQHEQLHLEPSSFFSSTIAGGHPVSHLDKPAHSLPFSMLAAVDSHHNTMPHLHNSVNHPISSYPAVNQFNQFIGCNYRNSFDFLEMDNNSNLLEMNGESYQRLYNRGGLVQNPVHVNGYESPRNTTPGHFLNNGSKPQVPNFSSNLDGSSSFNEQR
eukprot:403332525